jgi:hypothetical protein
MFGDKRSQEWSTDNDNRLSIHFPASVFHSLHFPFRVTFCPLHGGTQVRATNMSLSPVFLKRFPARFHVPMEMEEESKWCVMDCSPGYSLICNNLVPVYHRFGRDTMSIVSFVYGTPMIFTRSLEVGRQILSGGLDAFDKSPALEGPFSSVYNESSHISDWTHITHITEQILGSQHRRGIRGPMAKTPKDFQSRVQQRHVRRQNQISSTSERY